MTARTKRPGKAKVEPKLKTPNRSMAPQILQPPNGRRKPTDDEQADRAVVAARMLARRVPPPIKIEPGTTDRSMKAEPTTEDLHYYYARFQDLCGSRSNDWVDVLSVQLANVGIDDASPEGRAKSLGAGLAFLNGLAPRDEIEAALGAQMYAMHTLAMNMTRRAERSDHADWIRMSSDHANKAARTFAAQIEALARLRNGGKQQVIVKYVDARGSQNVIGDVRTGGGGDQDRNQSHATAPEIPGLVFAPGPPVWGEDAGRDAMPEPSRARQGTVQDARSESGRADREGERELSDGDAHKGDARSPADGARARQAGQGDA